MNDRDRRGSGRNDRFGDDNRFGGNNRFSGGRGNRFGGGGRGSGGGDRGGAPGQEIGEAKGVVKFFNSQKGFGFIQRDDGGEDVFVHISAVEQAGLAGLADGQPLAFTLIDRGGKISASNLQIIGEAIAVQSRPSSGGAQRQATGQRASGTVKFFNSQKGFGFIQRDDGHGDAFVHISAVERAGLYELVEGDRVEFEIEIDRRGKEAAINLVTL